jgi:hypothetical protein
VYRGFGKVAPAPLRGTIGKVVVEVVVGVVDVVIALVVVVEEEAVVVEVFVVVAVAIVVVVVVGWVVVVVVVLLLHALKTELATSSNDVKTTSHFLLNLLDNLHFSFSLISFIIMGYL